ncbi:MAG: O-antigen polymerase [Limnohabitans sp.]
MAIIPLIVHFLVFYFFYKKIGILHPASIFSFIWTVQWLGVLFSGDYFYTVSGYTMMTSLAGLISFSLGVILTSSLKIHSPAILNRDYANNRYLLTIAIFILLFFSYKIFQINTAFMSFDILEGGLAELRYVISIEEEDVLGIYKYGQPISLTLMLLTFIRLITKYLKEKVIDKPQLYLFFIFFCFSFYAAFFSTGRGIVLMIFISLIISYLCTLKEKKISRSIIKSGLVFTFLSYFIFTIMGEILGKVSGNFSDAINSIVNYQFSALPALSFFIEKNSLSIMDSNLGSDTIRLFRAIFSKLGFATPPESLVQEFVFVPIPTNIYSFYHFHLRQFGWLGVILFPFSFGVAHQIIYRYAFSKNSTDYHKLIFAISIIPLLNSTGGDTYFSNASIWISIGLIGFIFTRRKSHREV